MKFLHIVIFTFLFFVSFAYSVVLPEQVLIIANGKNLQSRELAEFYARERDIPCRNVLLLDLPERELISRQMYEKNIAYPIRAFLHQRNAENKIRVLVTMYGVPLKIGPARVDKRQRKLANVTQQRYIYAFKELEKSYRELERLAGVATTQPTTLPARSKISIFFRNLPILYRRIQSLYKRVTVRAKRISDSLERQMILDEFVRLRFVLEGRAFLLRTINSSMSENRAENVLNQLRELERQYWKLASKNPFKRDNTRFCELTRQYGGLMLLLKTLYEDYQRLTERDSASAVDSELSLVLWKDYPLAGRVPNALNPRFSNHPFVVGKGNVMMTCRLDAPSSDIVKRMIRESISVEQTGLRGNVYLDARGLKNKRGFIVYDNDLRNLGKLLRTKTSLKVILDNKSSLFAPGSCPDTALYCGWYSLRRYIPAFAFVKGAVGYHIASFEAQSLHGIKNNNLWCPKMLQAGVDATLGPVDEPFLDAFPLPSEFFGLLLTGKYNIVETFYKTIRYNSWRMILIADPLYNPFEKNPQLDENDVKMHKLSLLLIR